MIWLARHSGKIFSTTNIPAPSPYCAVCRVVYLPLAINPDEMTLGEFVKKVVIGELGYDGQVTVQEGARVLWETEDFEDNAAKTMRNLGMGEGTFVNVLDDDEPRWPVIFSITK